LGQEYEQYEAVVKGNFIYGRMTRNAKFSADGDMNEKNRNIELQ
jgi:hypothetical protein